MTGVARRSPNIGSFFLVDWLSSSAVGRSVVRVRSSAQRRDVGSRTSRGKEDTQWAPAIDVVQKSGDLVVRAELPGIKLEDVDMTVHQGVLTISGKRDEEREEERGGYLVRERRSGSFRRSLQLPEGADEDSIRARFENGVLEVTIEGAAAEQGPKRIQVECPSS